MQREDVALYVRERMAQPSAAAAPAAGRERRVAERQSLTGVRLLTAERMSQSAHTTAPVTLTTEVDATELVRLRETLKAEADGRPVPSYNVLLAKIVARALQEHPDLNASIEDGQIVRWASINIGIAVQTDRGARRPGSPGRGEPAPRRTSSRRR